MQLISYHQNQGGKKAELLSKGSQVAVQQAMRGSGLDTLKSLLSVPIAWQKWENSYHSAVHGVLWLGRLQRQSRPVIAEVLKSKSMWASLFLIYVLSPNRCQGVYLLSDSLPLPLVQGQEGRGRRSWGWAAFERPGSARLDPWENLSPSFLSLLMPQPSSPLTSEMQQFDKSTLRFGQTFVNSQT